MSPQLPEFAWDVGVALTKGGTLDSMLDLIAQAMVDHLGAAVARIWSMHPQQDGPELRGSAGRLDTEDGSAGPGVLMRFKLADVVRERRAIVTNSAQTDSRVDREWAAANGIISCAAVPLIVAEAVVGVMVMHARAPISSEIERAVFSAAHGVASAMEGKRIEAHRARLAAIIETMPDMVVISKEDYAGISYMNPAGRALLGIGADEPILTMTEFRPPGFAAELRDVILPTAIRDGIWSGETTYLRRDGRAISVAQQFLAHVSPNGKSQLSTIARDITERKHIEEELRATHERTGFAHAAAGIGIWEHDLTTGHVTWSESMPAMHGMTQPFAGTKAALLDMVHPDDRERVRKASVAAETVGDEFSVEFRIVWPDGSVHWIDARSQVRLTSDGLRSRILGVAIDITSRKALEAQLQQAQKMEAIGQLAGGVAHDFNNLLTVILGCAEFLTATPGQSDQHQRDVREIIKAAERASGLTRQLLAFSRKQVLKATLVDVNTLVSDMRDMLGRLIGENIQFITMLAPDLGAVFADQSQLEQVLMNLTVNARDAMPQGGRLTIETSEVHLDARSGLDQALVPGVYVMLTVTDTGTGMDAETRSRIFEPFFSTKDVDQGTGLGLATVYGIVKQSGGQVWVGSEPGHGAVFRVYLPRASGNALPAFVEAVAEPRYAGRETVLLVEDQAGVRHLTRRILESAGYRVIESSNASEAQALFTTHHLEIDLILTDVVMPGMSGPDLVRSVTVQKPTLKVVYMSGYNEDALLRQARLDRSIPFVQKPFSAAVLTRTVGDALVAFPPAAERR